MAVKIKPGIPWYMQLNRPLGKPQRKFSETFRAVEVMKETFFKQEKK